MTRRPIAFALSTIVLSLVFVLPLTVLADIGPTTDPGVSLVNPLGKDMNSLPALVAEIMQFVVRIGAIVVVFMLVYTGYLFVMARGNPGAIGKAKENLTWVVVGALILLGAQAISIGICETVNALSVSGSAVSCSF